MSAKKTGKSAERAVNSDLPEIQIDDAKLLILRNLLYGGGLSDAASFDYEMPLEKKYENVKLFSGQGSLALGAANLANMRASTDPELAPILKNLQPAEEEALSNMPDPGYRQDHNITSHHKLQTFNTGYPAGIKGFAMKAGEAWRAKGINQFLSDWDDAISLSASENGIEKDLLKSILKEELSHQLPGEWIAEQYLGMGDSVGPGQVRMSVWPKKLNMQDPPESLLDIMVNIDVAAEILAFEKKNLLKEGLPATPAMIGSRYNNGNTTKVTNYGRRIKNFYNQFTTPKK